MDKHARRLLGKQRDPRRHQILVSLVEQGASELPERWAISGAARGAARPKAFRWIREPKASKNPSSNGGVAERIIARTPLYNLSEFKL